MTWRSLRLVLPAIGFGVGAGVARQMLGSPPLIARAGLAAPLPVATGWGELGFALALALLVAVVIGLVARVVPGPDPGGDRDIIAAAALALAVALTWPVSFSSDPYAYLAYADLADRGYDPHLPVPTTLHDPYLDGARFQWSGPFPADVYGPAALGVARFVRAIAGDVDIAVGLRLWRVTMCGAFLLSLALVSAALRLRAPDRRRSALIAFGLNPVVLWSVAEGHNDVLFLLLLAIGVFLAARSDAWGATLGGIFIGASTLVKAPAVLLAGALATASWPIRRARIAALTIAALVVAAFVSIPPLWPVIRGAVTHGHYAPNVSAQGIVGPLAIPVALVVAVFATRAILRHERGGYAGLGIAAVLALPNTYPWYSLWLLPLAIADVHASTGRALEMMTILAILRYLPDAAGDMPVDPRVLAAVTLVPLTFVLPNLRRPKLEQHP